MGLLDQLAGGVLGRGTGGTEIPAGLADGLLDLVQRQGLDGIVKGFESNGLGAQAASWVSTGANQSIDAAQLTRGLGAGQLQALAAKTGLDVATLAPLVARFLPMVIDRLTPNGRIESSGGGLDSLGGLLSGMFGPKS